MTAPAVLLVALAGTGTASAGPVVVAVLSAAAAVGGPVVGGLLDRTADAGRLIGWFLMGCAVGTAAIGLLLGHQPLPLVLIIAAATGLLRPVISGGWSSRLHQVVDEGRLARAASSDAITFDLAAFSGPALVGVVALIVGPVSAVVIAAALMIIAGPLAPVAFTHPAGLCPEQPASKRLMPAMAAIIRIAPLRRATTVSTVSYLGMGLLSTSLPLLGRQVLGDPDDAPLLVAVLAGSGLAANLVISFRPTTGPDRLLLTSVVVLVPGTAMAALSVVIGHGSAAHVLAVVAMITVGMSDGPQLAAVLRIRHRESPARLRGGIFTTGASIKICGYAIGAAVSGLLAGRSLTAALLAAAGCQAAAVLTYRISARTGPAQAARSATL